MSEGWRAGATCPQCGAGLELEVGNPILSCEYCRTSLFLSSPGPLRYRLGTDPPGGGIQFLPFWRFRGLRFRVQGPGRGVQSSLLDTTVPAWPKAPPAASLGLRPQMPGLRLVGGSPEMLSERPVDQALSDAEARVDGLEPEAALFTRFIGETQTVVEAPFMVEEGAGGAVLREALPDARVYDLAREQQEALHSFLGQPGSSLDLAFLPLLCPECGSELPADPHSVAFLCGRCAHAWRVEGTSLAHLPYAARPGSAASRLFPFWELVFSGEDLGLRTRLDMDRWAGAYRPSRPDWGGEACRALVPGFKIQPRTFLRLARILSLAPLDIPDAPLSPDHSQPAEPVRLPYTEAAQALKVALAAMAHGRRSEFSLLPATRIRVERVRLIYLPFAKRGSEWVQEDTGLALQVSSVDRGSFL